MINKHPMFYFLFNFLGFFIAIYPNSRCINFLTCSIYTSEANFFPRSSKPTNQPTNIQPRNKKPLGCIKSKGEFLRIQRQGQAIYPTPVAPGNPQQIASLIRQGLWKPLDSLVYIYINIDKYFKIYTYSANFWGGNNGNISGPPEATIQHSTTSKGQFRQKPLTHPTRVHQSTQAFHVLTSFGFS